MHVSRRPCVAVLLPGPGEQPGKNRKLILPGQRTAQQKVKPSLESTESTEIDGRRPYRPPMGYFLKKEQKEEIESVEAELMIQRLSSTSGIWHTIAAYLPRLNDAGYDAQLLEELTGIPKAEQNILATAASVLQSIKIYNESHSLPEAEETFKFFDIEGESLAFTLLLKLNLHRIPFHAL